MNVADQRGISPLVMAIHYKHSDIVQLLLGYNTDINEGNGDGDTLLMHASGTNDSHSRVLKIILQLPDLELDITNNRGLSALHKAYFNMTSFRMLLEKGAEPNIKEKYGRTPLMFVARNSQLHETPANFDAEFFTKYKIDSNNMDDQGRTALSYAAGSGKEALLLTLLEVTDEPCFQDKSGLNALMYAILSDAHNSPEVLNILLQNTVVDPNTTDNEGRNPLTMAAQSEKPARKIELLLPVFQDLSRPNHSGQAAIAYLAGHQAEDSVLALDLLLNQEYLEFDTPDESGRTPLSWAVSNEQVPGWEFTDFETQTQTVKLFIDRGANLDTKCQNGRTLLSYATELGNFEVFQIILSLRPELRNIRCHSGRSPLSYAAERGRTNMAELLLSYPDADPLLPDDVKATPLEYATIIGHCDLVNILLEYEKDHGGITSASNALYRSAAQGHVHTINLLLKRQHIDIDFCSPIGDFHTPLSTAVLLGHLECVKVLVESGASLGKPLVPVMVTKKELILEETN